MGAPKKVTRKGLLIILSAPSGTGKTTIVERLLARDKFLWRSISATTRPPRLGEKNKRDYMFLTNRAFKERIKRGSFLEWARVFGRYYGTPRQPLELQLKRGRDVILVIDVKGATQVMRRRKTLSIFLKPPSLKELARRLANRNTNSPQERKSRLSLAKWEMAQAGFYDASVVNRDLNHTACSVAQIIERARSGKSV